MGLIRSRLERPRNIATSAGLDRYLREGVATWAGVNISPDTALQIGAVFACTRIIAEDIGKLPVILYQRSDRGAKDRATTSPFWRLLHDRPNSWQTSQQFRELLTAHAVLRGNAFAFKNLVGGQVRELLPIHPDRVRVEQLDDYEVIYRVRHGNGREEMHTRREIFHLAGPSLDGYQGVSIVGLSRQSMGFALALERHGATLFGNGAHPGGVLKHPGKLSDAAQKRLQASVDEGFARGSAHKTLILEEGMDWVRTGLSNEDSQFLQSRQFSILDIARWFRIPPHKLGELGRATWANIENQQLEYVNETLMSWARRWEDAYNQQVIGTNSVYAELLFDALLRGSTKERYEAYQLAAGGNAPFLTRNEVRRRENLPPIEGLDEMLQPLNMSGATPPPDPPGAEGDDDEQDG